MIVKLKKTTNSKINGITKAQLELYQYMQFRSKNCDQFNKDDLMEIYNRFVEKKNRNDYCPKPKAKTEEELYNNASSWLNRSIATLIREGYLGLIFRVDVGPIEDALEEDKCLT